MTHLHAGTFKNGQNDMYNQKKKNDNNNKLSSRFILKKKKIENMNK